MKLNMVLKVTFLTVGLTLLSFSYSFASFTQNLLIDTTSELKLKWTWDETVASTTYLSANWQANLSAGPKVGSLGWVVGWGFDHLKGPHAEDINPAPFFSTADFALQQNGIVIDRSGHWEHLTQTGNHYDLWTFTFDRDVIGKSGIATLDVQHAAPIPPSLLLFSTGLIGLIGIKRKKLFEKE
jgi:hypothetical protein